MGRVDRAGHCSVYFRRGIALRSSAVARADMVRRRYPIMVGLTLSAGLALPFAIRQNSWYEWANPYWLLLLQREHILNSGWPSYFISTTATGLYYPIHLFYAGFTISIVAYVAAVVPPPLVFSLTIGASFYAAFVGILWLGRALGVGTPLATVVAALYIANPQYVAKVYARGAWAEFVAVSMLTLLLGSAVRAMTDRRDGRSTTVPIAFVAIGTMFLAGTHNLTLALGLPFVAALVVAHAWTLHRDVRSVGRALLPPMLAASVGIAISGAFTIPNFRLSGSTAITGWDYLDQAPELNKPTQVFQPHASGLLAGVNEAPSLLLVPIALLAIAAFERRRRHTDTARVGPIAATAALVAMLLAVLTTRGSLWSNPSSILHRLAPEKALRTIQFPSRLTAFLALALVVLVLSLLRRAPNTRFRRVGQATIVAAAAWYVSLALVFAISTDRTAGAKSDETSYGVINVHSMPSAFAESQQTQFLLTERGVTLERPSRVATFDLDGHLDPATAIEPNMAVATNVVWSPFIRFKGAELLGRDEGGMAVIVTRSPTANAIAVTTGRPAAVVVGEIVSLLGLGAAAWWLVGVVRRRRRSTAPEASPLWLGTARSEVPQTTGDGRAGACQ